MEELGHTDSLGRPRRTSPPSATSRASDQDAFALHSHAKAVAAQDAGRFDDELVPVTVKGRKGDTVVDADEGPRRDSSIERSRKLRPAFTKDGTVTAGNSSPLNDGAAAVMVVSRRLREGARADAAGEDPRDRGRGRAAPGHGPRPRPGGREGARPRRA